MIPGLSKGEKEGLGGVWGEIWFWWLLFEGFILFYVEEDGVGIDAGVVGEFVDGE